MENRIGENKNSNGLEKTPQVSDESCQCDLGTEYYEQQLGAERQQVLSLNAELELKNAEIAKVNATLLETRDVLTSEISSLKEKISSLQVLVLCEWLS